MNGIGHINAFPPVGIDREIDDISGLRLDAYDIQDVGERHADPLRSGAETVERAAKFDASPS